MKEENDEAVRERIEEGNAVSFTYSLSLAQRYILILSTLLHSMLPFFRYSVYRHLPCGTYTALLMRLPILWFRLWCLDTA